MPTKTKNYSTAAQDVMNFLTRSKANQQLNLLMTFSGRVDAQRLARAIRIAMDREPVLGCRFVEQPNRTGWQRRDDLDALDLCPVMEIGATAEAFSTAWQHFCTAPTDPRQDPLLRAVLLRAPAQDTLCLKVDHVAADGSGAKEAAYLVADCYTRLEEDPTYHPGLGAFSPRGQSALFRQAGIKKLIQYRPRALHLNPPTFDLPFTGVENTATAYALRSISPEAFRALKAFGKQRGATLNDLILAAFFRALSAASQPAREARLSLQLSTDLRRYLPAGQPQRICNLSSAVFPAIAYRPEETFEQTLDQVQAAMQRWKAREPGLTGAMLIQLAMLQGYAKAKQIIGGMVNAEDRAVAPLLLSNLGVLDEERLHFGGQTPLSACELGPVLLGHGMMLSASTYREHMTLAFGYCQSNLPASIVENLLQQIQQDLLALIPDPIPADLSRPVIQRVPARA